MKAALQFYTGTSEEWESINPKPYDAVWCIEVLSGGRRLLKIGNGNDRWNDLEYMDESYIKGLPENLDELAASIADERARAQIEEGRLQGAIEAETERAAGAEQANALAAAAAQQTADDNNLLSGALAGDVETLKITLTKSEGSTIDISLADLETLFLRRSAAHDNGATSIGNEPGNDGFSLRSTEDDTNSAGGIETNTAAGNPLAAGMYLKHNVNADDNVRVLLLNNGTTKRAYLLKDKAVPLTRGEVDPDDELWNKKEIQNAINDAIAGFSTGLKMPVSLDMESHLPDPATAETGDYYRISNMDVSMPGQSGEAWFNPDISTTAWQKTINAAFAPDNTTLELNGDGQLAIKADVQALIDGAVQEEQVVTTPVTGSATDTEVLSAKNVFDHILGEAVAALRDGFATKRVVPALNQLFDEAGKIKKPFTYLVDSDEALADWANNVRTDGQDYTAVLIAPGTWTSAVEVNLTTSGTKVVVGMPGSTLSFTSRYGLRYTTLPTTTDYRMEGVKVEVNPSPTSGDFAGAFAYCANLTGCTGAVTTAGTNLEAAPFAYCVNLTGCTGTAHGEGVGIGFSNCAILTACTGTGTGEEIGYGFYSCRGMLQNQPGDTPSTTAAYGSCYVSISGSGPAPSDTALGGWNKGAGAPTDPLPVANGGTGADTAAQARVNLGIEGGISQFTYLVDSDEALADWANNVRTDGQDYTAVLIAPG
ncbi:MAG: hypothetical protein LBQ14_07965, partial [Treponema sp.]|nr:hypothetical protein [Treponema sp.]